MDKKTNEEKLAEIKENTYRWSRRWANQREEWDSIDGKPTGNEKDRHRCCYCKSRKYEKDMHMTGGIAKSNFRTSIKWACDKCPIGSYWTQGR